MSSLWWWLLSLAASLVSRAEGQACTRSSPGFDPDVPDYSGVSPIQEPPIVIGDSIIYKCPGVKTFQVGK